MNIQVILKELAKTGVIALTEEAVKTFVETKIKPIFTNWGKDESRSIELENCLSEYLLRCYAKNNIMTTIVFGKLQKTLEDLYIPLILQEYRNEEEKWIIDDNCYDILEKYNRILIVDMAGMGKSTIVKYFACQGMNLDKSIPIVIELRKLKNGQTILEFIQKQIKSFDNNIEINEIVAMLKKGDFVIFFDGYDEIANENKPEVLDTIQEFTSNANNTKIVITSREDDNLTSLGEFKCVNIKPLNEEEAYKLIRKYDNDGEISKKLIKRLKEDSSIEVLNEFLSNPLLVSLLYKTFEYKEEIPYKKIGFYAQVYEALFNDHDKTKGSAYVHEKRTKLDKYQFEQVLRAFGFLCLKTDKVEYSSQLIHQLLEQSIKRFGWLKISVDDFLYDVTHAVPFIQKDGNEYKWIHKSFMEYFAACFICYDNKELEEKYFSKISSDDYGMKYYNVLDFCYEMDTLSFRKNIILPCLKHFIEKSKKYFQQEYFYDYNPKYIKMAQQLMVFSSEIYVVKKVLNLDMNESSNKLFSTFSEIADNLTYEIGYGISMIIHSYYDEEDNYAYLYRSKNIVLYDIMVEKMPEIFEKVNLYEKININIPQDVAYNINDDCNNFINRNKEIFYTIIYNAFNIIFRNDKILVYNKCKNLIEEIESENNFANDDIFDL